MRLSRADVECLSSLFPSLTYDGELKRIGGRLCFGARYDGSRHKLDIVFEGEESQLEGFLRDQFDVEIRLDEEARDRNGWPEVRETGGRCATIANKLGVPTADIHVSSDGSCCLGIRFTQERRFSIKNFLVELVVPYFYWLSYAEQFGIDATRRDLWGEYSHGHRGMIEYHEEIGSLSETRPGRNDPCPCGSGRKYKHCHMDEVEAMERKNRG